MSENIKKAIKICQKNIKKLGLPMKIICAVYNSDERKLIFKFESENRVDFRELIKLLQQELSTKIELRQIGPRDKAKEIGGVGPCGEMCCCKKYLKDFQSTSVNLIKKQNLQGTPQRYTGYCGKLMCCLNFETCPKKNEVITKVINKNQ